MTEQATTVEKTWVHNRYACEYTGYDRTTLWRATRRGDLRVGGLPGSPRFELAELNKWMRGEKEA